jgi:hypothetical protein
MEDDNVMDMTYHELELEPLFNDDDSDYDDSDYDIITNETEMISW